MLVSVNSKAEHATFIFLLTACRLKFKLLDAV